MTKKEFMAMSLPYGLKFIFNGHPFTLTTVSLFGVNLIDFDDCKPILLPLTYLTKEIEHNGDKFIPIDFLKNYYTSNLAFTKAISDILVLDLKNVRFSLIQKLIEWHFDIAGLIEKGEAIDVKKLSENPYK